jgi:MFS transporter, DHA1 family, tetracycline resistance protein
LQLRNALALPVVRRLVTVGVLFILPFSLMQVALPIMARDTLGWGPGQLGTLLMLVGLCDIVAQGLLLPHLIRALGEGRVARAGLVLGVVGMAGLALLPLYPLTPVLYLSVLLLAVGEGLYTACMTTLISLAIPADQQGRVQGGAQAMGELAQSVGPLVSGQLYARLGPAATFGIGAAVVALALGALISGPTGKPQAPNAAT